MTSLPGIIFPFSLVFLFLFFLFWAYSLPSRKIWLPLHHLYWGRFVGFWACVQAPFFGHTAHSFIAKSWAHSLPCRWVNGGVTIVGMWQKCCFMGVGRSTVAIISTDNVGLFPGKCELEMRTGWFAKSWLAEIRKVMQKFGVQMQMGCENKTDLAQTIGIKSKNLGFLFSVSFAPNNRRIRDRKIFCIQVSMFSYYFAWSKEAWFTIRKRRVKTFFSCFAIDEC